MTWAWRSAIAKGVEITTKCANSRCARSLVHAVLLANTKAVCIGWLHIRREIQKTSLCYDYVSCMFKVELKGYKSDCPKMYTSSISSTSGTASSGDAVHGRIEDFIA